MVDQTVVMALVNKQIVVRSVFGVLNQTYMEVVIIQNSGVIQ